MGDRKDARENVNLIVTGVLALGLLALFWVLSITAIGASADPPRQADPAPRESTAVGRSTVGSSTGSRPEQARGAFSTFDRRVIVVGLVSPLLTTIVGFYFGTRVSASERRAAEADAQSSRQMATSTAVTAREVVNRMSKGEQAQSVLGDIAQKNPEAYARITSVG
ncbi:hypothetical protein [Streptomyces sp. NPDC046939]|uniref:hypothetical protein n=1 Tax=Streptomyces sp. NPDC046939 TaxID=3155376 RepID=UPI0033D749F7